MTSEIEGRILKSLAPGVSVVVGSVSAAGIPACCRAAAMRSTDNLRTATIFVPVATSQETMANVAETGRLAVVSTYPVEHLATQFKGTARSRGLASEDEREFVRGVSRRLPASAERARLSVSRDECGCVLAGLRDRDAGRSDFRAVTRSARRNETAVTSKPKLSELSSRCFQGVVPALIATADAAGTPNVTYLSQVYYVDDTHVALSCQFFNKTRRNLDDNPLACVEMYDPMTLQAYRLRLKFLRSEKSGPLFDAMSSRIDAIASATGMKGIFKLIAADVLEVQALEKVEGFLLEGLSEADADRPTLEGHRTEIRGLQWVSDRVNRSCDLESLLAAALQSLEEFFQFCHTSVLLYEEGPDRLVTLASRGYGASGIGAEVPLGQGIIGTAARNRQVMRFSSLDADLGYAHAIRRAAGGQMEDLPPPGLPDAKSLLVIPLIAGGRLVGLLAAEDRDPLKFDDWHEAYLQIVANQIALGIDRMAERSAAEAEAPARLHMPAPPPSTGKTLTLTYYRNDDAIFVGGEYLIRNIPARILWKLLAESQRTGRTEFTNREVRLDESLGLPPVKDNFESRLILLRHRLEEKCPAVQIVSTGRGRFALQTSAAIEMREK